MILITGGRGFIGSYLYDFAKQYDDVVIIDNLSNPSFRSKNNNINIDLSNTIPDLQNIDIIYHLAADISVINSISNPKHNYQNNVISTLNILELARRLDAKIVFSSSAAVYAPSNTIIDEDHSLSPISIYGLSKLHSEQLIQMYNRLYGLEYCILRYSNVYGYGAKFGVIPTFISRMLTNQTIEIYGDPIRDFVYVEDVAMLTYIARYYTGIYNLSTGKGVKIRDVFNILSNILNYDKPPIIKGPRIGEIEISILDNSKLLKTFDLDKIGWKGFVNIEEGLKRTLTMYSSHQQL